MKKQVKKHHQQKKFAHCLSSHGCLREQKKIMNVFSVSARLKTKRDIKICAVRRRRRKCGLKGELAFFDYYPINFSKASELS